jgi:hypothetical protein
MTNKLELGVVPEIGDLSVLPTHFSGQPTYAPSGGNVSIAHTPVANLAISYNFAIFIRANVVGQTIVEVSMLLADSSGTFRTIVMQNRGGGMFTTSAPTSLLTWNQPPRLVDRYAFRIILSGGSVNFIGTQGVFYSSLPSVNCILPG